MMGGWAMLLAFPLFLVLVVRARRTLASVNLLIALMSFFATVSYLSDYPAAAHAGISSRIGITIQAISSEPVLLPLCTFALISFSRLVEYIRDPNQPMAKPLS